MIAMEANSVCRQIQNCFMFMVAQNIDNKNNRKKRIKNIKQDAQPVPMNSVSVNAEQVQKLSLRNIAVIELMIDGNHEILKNYDASPISVATKKHN